MKGHFLSERMIHITENGNREREFAYYLLTLGNPEEAAMKLGARPDEALAEGMRLMTSGAVRREIKRLKKSGVLKVEAVAGLRRLAFGRINDAAALLCDEPPPADRLDLYNVSEIKRPKGGGVEIKFFDRLEALEQLAEIETRSDETSSADSFFSALTRSAKETDG